MDRERLEARLQQLLVEEFGSEAQEAQLMASAATKTIGLVHDEVIVPLYRLVTTGEICRTQEA
jgi:hypothetical protein